MWQTANDIFASNGMLLFMLVLGVLCIFGLVFTAPRETQDTIPDDNANFSVNGSGDLHGYNAWYTNNPDNGGKLVYVITPNGKLDPYSGYEISNQILKARAMNRYNDIDNVLARGEEEY